MSDEAQPRFSIEKIYVKDLSLEIPGAPQVFLEREPPQVEVALRSEASAIDEGVFDVTVTVTVTAKLGERTIFLVEAAQAGIFAVSNVPNGEIEPILAIACPNILFPYARETVSDMVNRAGFPPVLLAPVNFEALYQERLQQQGQHASAEIPIQ